jgi:multidrug transporter EmrE-like cation transporter
MQDIFTKPMHLIGLTSLFYVLATIAMKQAASGAGITAFAILAGCLALGAVFEILTFRQASMGAAYVTILAVETLLILGFAAAIGEGLAPREVAGAALVLSGAALLST